MLKAMKDLFLKLPKNEDDLVTVSDDLWKLGGINEIKEKVTFELFIAHICINIVGNHQSDGWGSILLYNTEIIPYIPQALDALSLPEIKGEFYKVLDWLSTFEQGQIPDNFYEHIEELDNLSDLEWGLGAEKRGWGGILSYISDNYNF